MIVVGAGEFTGMLVSGMLITACKVPDKPLLYTMVTLNLVFMTMMYFFGEISAIMNYISLFSCLACICGCFNVAFLMVDARIMPTIMGAYVEIVVGLGTMSCFIVPFVLSRGLEFTMVVAYCYGIPLFVLLCLLPAPLG